jgi:hypothetical protein
MSKIKQEYFDLALETGGSHYPGVGGQLLSTFGDLVAKECIAIALKNNDVFTAQEIEQRFGITRDIQL